MQDRSRSSGDAVAQRPRDLDALQRCDRRSRPSTRLVRPSLVAASRPKKMSKSRAIGRQASSRSGMTRDEIDAALDQDPLLADLSAPQLHGEGAACAPGGSQKRSSGDEDLVAAAGQSPDRPTLSTAREQIAREAARSNRTSSGTGSLARVSISHVGRCGKAGVRRRQPSTSRREGSGTSSRSNGVRMSPRSA